MKIMRVFNQDCICHKIFENFYDILVDLKSRLEISRYLQCILVGIFETLIYLVNDD